MKKEYDIPLAWKHVAAALERWVLRNVEGRPNYTTIQKEHRYYIGYLGELAVEQWLTDNKVDFRYNVNASGSKQPSEFKIRTARKGKEWCRLEVKTASKPFHKYCGWPISQGTEFDVVIGCRLSDFDEGVVQLLGSASSVEAEAWKVGTFPGYTELSRAQPFGDMHDIDDILRLITTGQWETRLANQT